MLTAGGKEGVQGRRTYPAVHFLAFLALAHASDVVREDTEQSNQHCVRLGTVGELREEVGHDGGALHDEPGHILQRQDTHKSLCMVPRAPAPCSHLLSLVSVAGKNLNPTEPAPD